MIYRDLPRDVQESLRSTKSPSREAKEDPRVHVLHNCILPYTIYVDDFVLTNLYLIAVYFILLTVVNLAQDASNILWTCTEGYQILADSNWQSLLCKLCIWRLGELHCNNFYKGSVSLDQSWLCILPWMKTGMVYPLH